MGNLKIIENNRKKCSKCYEIIESINFNKAAHHKDGLKSECKKCEAKYHAELYRKNDTIKLRNKAWQKANPDWRKTWQKNDIEKNPEKHRNRFLKRTWGITLEQYNNIFSDQGGKCGICKRHQSELKQTLCVDHCHKTGKIRKLLCGPCNHAIGLLQENIKTAKSVVAYLQEYTI